MEEVGAASARQLYLSFPSAGFLVHSVVLQTIILIGPVYPLMFEMRYNRRKVNTMHAHYLDVVFILLLICDKRTQLSRRAKTIQTISCPYALRGNILTNIYNQICRICVC